MTDKLQTFVDLPFADGVYRFQLGLRQLDELQEKCGCGIGRIIGKVLQGRPLLEGEGGLIPFGDPLLAEFDVRHITETIRLALIGGNRAVVGDAEPSTVTPPRAAQLVANYVQAQPLSEAWALAAATLGALFFGVPADQPDPGTAEAPRNEAEPAA